MPKSGRLLYIDKCEDFALPAAQSTTDITHKHDPETNLLESPNRDTTEVRHLPQLQMAEWPWY